MKLLIQTNKENPLSIPQKFFSKFLKKGIPAFLFFILCGSVKAQITAVQSGPWSDPNTWDVSVPSSGDDVIIGNSFTVNVNSSGESCNSIQIGDVNGSGSLVFSGTSSLTVAGDMVMGDLSGGTLGTLSLSANATLTCGTIVESDPNFSGAYDSNNGTIIFTGAFTLPFNLYQFNNLVVTGFVTAGGRNLPIEGNLSINAGGTLDLGVNSAQRNSIGGTLTIQNGATLKIGGSGNIPANYTTHIIGATSVVEYYGVSQTVSTLNSSQNYGYLIISGTGLKEVNGNIGIARDLTVNSGIFSVNTFLADRTSAGGTLSVANGATLRIAGSGTFPANFSTHTIGATSTIEYSGTSAQNIAVLNSGQKYGNLNIYNSFKTLSGSITVAGTLSFAGTPDKLIIGSNTLTLEGTISGSLTGSRNFSGSATSNLVLKGTSNRTLFFDATTPGTTNVLNNLTLNHSTNTSTLGNDLIVNNTLTFTSGKLSIAARTLTLKGGIVNTVTGSVVGGANSKLIFNGSSSPTLSMDQTTPGTTNNLSTLQINSSGQVITMGNDLVMSSTLTFTTGKLAINGNTLTLKGLVTNTVTGGIRAGSTSNLILNGAVSPSLSFDQTTPGTTNVIKNVTVNSSGQTITLTNGLRLVGTHTPTTGVFASGGNYTIASTAAATANVAAGTTSGGYITGSVIVERYIPQNTNRAWRLLTSPTSGQTINAAWQESQSGGVNGISGYGTNITNSSSSWAANGFDFQTPSNSILVYSPSLNNFTGVNNTGVSISNEPGYLIYIRGNRSVTPSSSISAGAATTLRTAGTLYTGDQSAQTVGADKLALIGNPYASALDLRNITLTGGSVGSSFYVWDPKLLGSYNIGGFQTLTESGGNYIVVPGGGSYGSTGSVVNTIESGAAFMVQAVSSSGTITINEASKTSGSRMVFRPMGNNAQMLNTTLLAKNNGVFVTADGAIVLFDNAYNNAIDGWDSKKINNLSETFSIVKDGANLVAEKRKLVTEADTVFFKMIYMKKIDYKLQIVSTNLDQANMPGFLEDSYTGTSKALDMSDTTNYDFTVDNNAGSYAASRFRIVFKPAVVLAVTFTNVHAALQGKKVQVDWNVVNQVSTTKYEIEKSINGHDFALSGTVAAGINGINNTYSWIDENPAIGLNYYRIKSVESVGTGKYSSIVKVNINKLAPSFSITPNPAEGNLINLQFVNQQTGKYNMIISSATGQIIYSNSKTHNGGSSVHQLQLPASVTPGTYQLEIVAPDNTRQVQKLLIR